MPSADDSCAWAVTAKSNNSSDNIRFMAKEVNTELKRRERKRKLELSPARNEAKAGAFAYAVAAENADSSKTKDEHEAKLRNLVFILC